MKRNTNTSLPLKGFFENKAEPFSFEHTHTSPWILSCDLAKVTDLEDQMMSASLGFLGMWVKDFNLFLLCKALHFFLKAGILDQLSNF